MKRIILTGATSMIGTSLIQECMRQHTEVVALVRRNSNKLCNLPHSPLLSVIPCDLNEIGAFDLLAGNEYDAFYHLAWGYTDKINRHDPNLQLENVSATLDAAKLAARLKCRRFIGAGSQAEYGRLSRKILWNDPVNPDSAYGIAKYAAGRLASLYAKELDIDFIWTRIFSVYGYYDMPGTMIMSCIDAFLKGESPQLTACEQMWDYLFCEDAAKALYLLGSWGRNQTVYNIGSGNALKLSDYVFAIRDEINPDIPINIGAVPYAENQIMYLCADISNLVSDTGFQPINSFQQGIRKTIKWYRNMVKS